MKQKILKGLTDYLYIAVGSFLFSFATSFFLVPFKISTGGVSGISTVLYHSIGIPMSITSFVINGILFLFAFRILKKSSILKTLVAIVLFSLFLEVTAFLGCYTEDVLIASLFGGVLVGLGIGITILRDASTGGTDFAALMLRKFFPHISVANFILMIDLVVIASSGVVYKDYTCMFYSAISLYISTKVTDFILVRGDKAKSVYIVSKQSNIIAEAIIKNMQRGVTGVYSKGFYDDKDGMMLMCIVRSKEIPTLLRIVKQKDRSAFTVVSEVLKVKGEGFSEF